MPESHSKNPTLLRKANVKQLRLPTMSAECEKLSREASAAGEDHPQYLLRLTELEVAARSTNALKARIKTADFPVHKDFDTYDFTTIPSLNKQKVMELARGEWIDQHFNCCCIGNAGTAVRDRQAGAVRISPAADRDAAAARGVTQGIVDQVGKYLL